MIAKNFDDIETSDIEAVIRNQVPESRWIDYKEALPGNTDEAKKEFLRDAISFANANGGDLLFGIRETRDAAGKPTGLPDPDAPIGISGLPNVDAEIRRMEDIVTHGAAPRITGVRMKELAGFSEGPVVIVRIGRSWAAPHLVTFKTRSPFTIRRSASRIDMDVTDLRQAFLAQAAVGEQIKTFRQNRLEMIRSGATGIERNDVPLLVIHIVPIAAIDPLLTVDISKAASETTNLQPLAASAWDYRFNFDGFITVAKETSGSLRSYTQAFRSGGIEAVGPPLAAGDQKTLHVTRVASDVFRVVSSSLDVQRRFGIEPPTSVLVTLLNVEGYRFITLNPFLVDAGNLPIDRPSLLLPEVLVTERLADIAAVSLLLRPVLDALWQAAGFARCFEYRASGEWNPNRQ